MDLFCFDLVTTNIHVKHVSNYSQKKRNKKKTKKRRRKQNKKTDSIQHETLTCKDKNDKIKLNYVNYVM